MQFKSIDKELIENVKKFLHSEHKIGEHIENSGYSNNTKYYVLSFKNKKIAESLKKFDVDSNKSYTAKFPINIPEELVKHFIRGYFDGDGSIYYSNNSPTVSFVGTENLLKGIQKHLQTITNSKANLYKYKDKSAFDYKIGGKNNVKKIY